MMMSMASLILLSLLTGILWRLELHLRWGWASLDWIGPFHWAFPLAAGAFLAWMTCQLRSSMPRTRQVALGVTAVLGLAAYFGGSIAMEWANNRWIVLLPRWQCLLYMASPVFVYLVLGAVYFGMVSRIVSPSLSCVAGGTICYALAFPIAVLLLWLTDHKGGSDTIHAIKSGFVFPIITFALGLPLAWKKGVVHAQTFRPT